MNSNETLEQQLLATQAGRAVFDSLVQANVNLGTVSTEVVKQMLVAEFRYQKILSGVKAPPPMLAFA